MCRKGPPKCVRICLPGAGIQDVRNRVSSEVGLVVGPGGGGGGGGGSVGPRWDERRR